MLAALPRLDALMHSLYYIKCVLAIMLLCQYFQKYNISISLAKHTFSFSFSFLLSSFFTQKPYNLSNNCPQQSSSLLQSKLAQAISSLSDSPHRALSGLPSLKNTDLLSEDQPIISAVIIAVKNLKFPEDSIKRHPFNCLRFHPSCLSSDVLPYLPSSSLHPFLLFPEQIIRMTMSQSLFPLSWRSRKRKSST